MIHSRYLAAEETGLRVVLTELGRVEVFVRTDFRVIVVFRVLLVILSVVGEEDVLAGDMDLAVKGVSTSKQTNSMKHRYALVAGDRELVSLAGVQDDINRGVLNLSRKKGEK